jgi:hypothetical protein
VHQLHELGWALPALGGISHQTVAGFLATGSAGASLHHDLTDAVAWIKLVDGRGEVRVISRAQDHELFSAALVNLGLLGVVVEVGFSSGGDVPEPLPKRFDVCMESHVTKLDDWEYKPFEEGELANFFERHEYARFLWWPQRGVEKVDVWTGRRVEYDEAAVKKPYVSVTKMQQRMASWIYRHILHDPDLRDFVADEVPQPGTSFDYERLKDFIANLGTNQPIPPELGRVDDPAERLREIAEDVAAQLSTSLTSSPFDLVGSTLTAREHLVKVLLNLFIVESHADDLRDVWYDALPHDNQVDDNLMPVVFTEMWVPMEKAHLVMQSLRDLFAQKHLLATGTMCFEIYAAKASESWLSPAHETPVLRVDPFVFWVDRETRKDAIDNFFSLHWQQLKQFAFRCHWGKVLPPYDGETGVAYREKNFAKLGKFRELRKEFDPEGIFLNQYWRNHLGIRP